MKKLKIFGKKEKSKGFIATICVDNNKLIIEAENPKVKKDLTHLIIAGLHGDLIQKLEGIDTPEGGHKTTGIPKKPGDSDFLETLKGSRLLVGGKVGGYEIYGWLSKIVEE